MPEIPIDEGKTKMPGDISDDDLELLLGESSRSHQALMHDSRANEQSAHNVLNHSGVRKYSEVDPIEAAGVEMILGKAQVVIGPDGKVVK